MRRAIVVMAAVAAFLLAATPVAAGTFSDFKLSGRGADAYLTTFRPGGPSEPAFVYVRTYLFAGDEVEWFDHTAYPTKQLFFRTETSGFDIDGNPVSVTEIVGYATGDAVTWSADNQLTKAFASATVTLARCGGETCVPYGTAEVRVSWTGVGDLTRGVGVSVSTSGSETFVSHGRSARRYATVTALIDGVDTTGPGTDSSATIFNVSSASLGICHGRC